MPVQIKQSDDVGASSYIYAHLVLIGFKIVYLIQDYLPSGIDIQCIYLTNVYRKSIRQIHLTK